MIFQTHKLIILASVIFCLLNVVYSYQYEDLNQTYNQTQNYIQMEQDKQIEQIEQVEQFERINPYPKLFQYNIFPLIVCIFLMNQ